MWHLDNIPKIMHCYWGVSRPLSFFRYLTVASFSKLNPDWAIKVYSPKNKNIISPSWERHEEGRQEYTGETYFKYLQELNNVKIYEIDFSETIVEKHHDVFKSDFLRWHLLRDIGGLWSDFDIIYFKPIEKLKENIPSYSKEQLFLCRYNKTFRRDPADAIGFLMAKPGNKVMGTVCSLLQKTFSEKNYQSIGNSLLKKAYTNQDKFILMEQDCVYPISYNNLNYESFKKESFSSSIGFHWYGGSILMIEAENKISEKHNLLSGNIEENIRETLMKVLF